MNDTTGLFIYTTTGMNNFFSPQPGGSPPPGGSTPPGGSPPPDGAPPGSSGGGGAVTVITNLQRNLALYGYTLLFLFGFFGHANSILIFLRHTLRSVSTSSLFICVAISDIIYLLVCIDDFLYTGLGLSLVNQQTNSNLADILCRFRSFIQSVAMCSSAWLLLTIAIDRWLRIRFPFKVKKLCTRKRVLFGALIVLICAITLNSHLLLPSFGSLSGTNICGPGSNATYSFFFRQIWGILFACLQTVLPTILLLIVTIDMFRRLRLQQKKKQRLNQNRRRAFLDRQMLIIMLTSIFLFFSTQIPLSLFNILLSPVLQSQLTMTQALELTSIFNLIASINFATTFYVHCLTSGLFREEFFSIIRCNRQRRVGVVTRILGMQITQTRGQEFRTQEQRNQQLCAVETVL